VNQFSEGPAEADHATTNLGDLAGVNDLVHRFMTRPWSRFSDADFEEFVSHVTVMTRVYRTLVGKLAGPSPLQVTMYSGPLIDGRGPRDVRTWIEWSGGSLSCWNARPLHPTVGGVYDWNIISRIWRSVHTPKEIPPIKGIRKVTPNFIYVGSR
jgi:hypothetical protein